MLKVFVDLADHIKKTHGGLDILIQQCSDCFQSNGKKKILMI